MSVTARAAQFLRFSRIVAVLVALVGGAVLFGWWLDIALLKSVAPGLVTMKANTATSFLCTGMALALLDERSTHPLHQRLGLILAVIVLLIAGLTVAEYAGRMDFGIDELLFRDDPQPTATSHSGRMAPMTAICLTLSSLALLLLDRLPRAADKIAMLVLVLATLATTGYVFGAQSLYQVATYTSMAIHTAVSLMVLSLGIIAARTQQGSIAIIISDSAGGEMARRLLWFVPLLLFALGWLVFLGHRADYYDDQFGMALVIVSGMAFSSIVILGVARLLEVLDGERQQTRDQLATLNVSLEKAVKERTRELENANQLLAREIAERKLAEEEVHRLSLTDELTGLLNRRGFLLLAEQDIKAARRANAVHALIFLDLDGLKRVNDTLGHRTGDAMIKDTAQVLKASFRDADIIGRLGGDEFAILANNGEHTDLMLSRIQTAATQFNKGDLARYQLSYSVGVVRCLPTEEKSLLELLAEADALMYEQKKQRHLQK